MLTLRKKRRPKGGVAEPKVIQKLPFIRVGQNGVSWQTDFHCAH